MFNSRYLLLGSFLLLTLALNGAGPAASQQINPAPSHGQVTVGKPLFVAAATAVCGPLSTHYPFDPKTYGMVRGYSPTTTGSAKIVLYTRTLDARFFRLAAAVDTLIAKRPALAESQVIVIDEKGAQRGGYTLDELQQRREAIRKLVAQNRIDHLSFFVSAPGATYIAPRLGLSETGVLIASLAPKELKAFRASVLWFTTLETSQIDDKTLDSTVAALEKSLPAPPSKEAPQP